MASVRMLGKVTATLLGSLQPLHRGLKTIRPAAFLRQGKSRHPLLGNHQALLYSTLPPSSDVSLKYKHGRLALEVLLPSRNEKCLFYLRPMLMSVGDLIADLQQEDPGATASVFSKDGEHVVSTTLIETLLDKGFKLIINDTVYNVQSSETACTSREHAVEMEDVKHVVHMLHTALHLPEHHLQKERQLLERLDHLKQELSPLEKMKAQLCRTAEFKASRVLWTGLAFLSVQGGALAWLTWWVYSWDVMEPVTYFITYSTSIGVFSYYVLTKQMRACCQHHTDRNSGGHGLIINDTVYDVQSSETDRQFLHYFYKGASKKKFNVKKYNELKDDLAQVEEELKRLRCSTQLQMPLEQIQSKP